MYTVRIVVFCLLLGGLAAESSAAPPSAPPKPYRALVVIGNQWTDPLSYSIDANRVRGGEFIDVVTMLKIWGVPFDVLRLDQQRLQINRFLDGETKPRYGCVIWLADPDSIDPRSANYQVLTRIVDEYGMSVVALFDCIKARPLADLIGVDYRSVAPTHLGGSGARLVIAGGSPVTEGAAGVALPDEKFVARPSIVGGNGITLTSGPASKAGETVGIVQCSAGKTIGVLGKVGENPQLTVRDAASGAKVIWIGGGKDWFRKYPVMRRVFRNALVESIGYGLFNDTFDNGFIFIMDDVGCSEHAWSLRWHYPTPSKETLLKYLIEPLEKRGLVMVQFLTSGFANPEKKIIEVPWMVKPFKDIFGNWQDYGSTKAGLDEGLRRGVFEIQAHRAWSHMNWDLDSPPGPWWGSPVGGELAKTDWYNEIVDVRRGGKSVPSNDLLFIYRSGIDAIRKAFGVTALAAEVRTGAEVREGEPGGDDNGRVAAIAGLGVSRECYVGFDRTIEFSMMMPEQFTCHDLDLTERTGEKADQTEAGWDTLLTMTTEQLLASKIAGGRRAELLHNQNWIESRKDKHWMGFNETCAYIHAEAEETGPEGLQLALRYDDHYCKYFENHRSTWTLELSERLRRQLGSARVRVDGRPPSAQTGRTVVLDVPVGLGVHRIVMQ